MTDTQVSLPPPSTAPSKPKAPPVIWPLWLLLTLLLAAGSVAAVYFWLSLDKQSSRIDHAQTIESNIDQRVSQLERVITRRIRSLEDAANTQSTLLTTLDKQALFNTKLLNQLHGSNRADWLLAETEYLLRLANQRLSIESDVRGAEVILVSADKVLAETDDPGLLPVRKKLAEEILNLQAIPTIDIDGLYVKLEALISSLDQLNERHFFDEQSSSASSSEAKLQSSDPDDRLSVLWREIWSDLKRAVVVRRLDQPIEPLLTPEQSYYLKQNLRLMLEQASVALLDQKQDAFRHSLEKASQWIDQYFTDSEVHNQMLLQTIQQLSQTNITHTLPDISGSLQLLKVKIEAMYRHHQLDRLSSDRSRNEEAQGEVAE